jgi:hypothetical protein
MTALHLPEVAQPVHDDAETVRPWPHLTKAQVALIVVCLFHALSPLIIRGLHSGYGTDETVYISQIDPHVPAGIFSAPRARGMTLLTAPASLLSPSLAVMRVWLALLSGIGLFVALIPWLRLRNGAVVPLAAALWSCLWVSVYYSYEAMPNQYVAYGALAATGWCVLALRKPARRRNLVYVGIALTYTALIRPSDSVFLLLALAGSALLVRGVRARRRLVVLTVMALGLAAGFAEWIVEAYARFGGPVARFHAASLENTGGLHWSLGAQLRTLAGPILCRAGCHAAAPLDARLWWFALVPLVGLGLAVAHRRQAATMYVVATAAGLAIAAEYIVAIGYSAPRFLEPTYALLALPVAEGVVWFCRRLAPTWQPIVITALALAAVAQLSVQTSIVQQLDRTVAVETARDQAIASSLNVAGIHGPCSISGLHAAAIVAFLAHCRDAPRSQPDLPVATSHERQTAVAVIRRRQPDDETYFSSWPEYRIQGSQVAGVWRVWLSPGRSTEALERA